MKRKHSVRIFILTVLIFSGCSFSSENSRDEDSPIVILGNYLDAQADFKADLAYDYLSEANKKKFSREYMMQYQSDLELMVNSEDLGERLLAEIFYMAGQKIQFTIRILSNTPDHIEAEVVSTLPDMDWINDKYFEKFQSSLLDAAPYLWKSDYEARKMWFEFTLNHKDTPIKEEKEKYKLIRESGKWRVHLDNFHF